MNNAEFRSQIAREMIALRKEKNSRLDTINNVGGIDEFVKELARGQILENFYNGIDELRKRPGYEEAKLTLEPKRKAFLNRNRLLSEKDKKEGIVTEIERINQELDAADVCLSMANFCHLGKGDKEIILRDIRNSHIRINKCTKEQLGYSWLEKKDPYDKKYKLFEGIEFCVDLPKIGSFKGFKSKFFIPCFPSRFDMTIEDRELEMSFKSNLADVLRNYLLEFGVEIDKGVDYDRDIHDTHKSTCAELLEFILSISRRYVNAIYK